jgi:hypothetical protein
MKTRYLKVKTGFKDEDFISITENELETAMYAFLTDSKAVLNNGAVNGRNIMSITEDWHREFGWNYGYKLLPEDFQQINAEGGHYKGLIALVKENVQGYIANNQIHLIGKTDYSSMQALPEKTDEVEPRSLRQLLKPV